MTECQNSGRLQGPAFANLCKFLEKHRATRLTGERFERYEFELHAAMSELEADLIGQKLAEHDVPDEQIRVGEKLYRRVALIESTYMTAAGPTKVKRHLFEAKGEHHSVCPLELQVGIIEGEYTPRAARLMAFLMSEMPSAMAEKAVREFGGMTPSRCALDRLPKKLSERWEARGKEWEEALSKREPIPEQAVSCAISLDGVHVPMKKSEARQRQEAEGKQAKGPVDYREVGCGTMSFYDGEGNRLVTWRWGRMPEKGKATLKELLRDRWAATQAERPDLYLVRMSDGAEDHWGFLHTLDAERATDVEDFWHACEHLHLAANTLFGEGSADAKRFFELYKLRLKEEDDGVDAVINALSYRVRQTRKGRRKVKKIIRYFRKRRRRMPYARCLRDKLPIGTGVMEAACRTLASERMKQSGMRWGMKGGQAILTLRSLMQSERWEPGWALLRESYTATITLVAA